MITWIDDSSKPRLKNMNNVDIQLFAPDDDRKVLILLPSRSLSGYHLPGDMTAPTSKSYLRLLFLSTYRRIPSYIRFVSFSPHIEVYTATFTILNMSSIAALTPGPHTPGAALANANQTTPAPDAFYTPYLTLVLPNTTITSALAPRPTSSRAYAVATPVTPLDQSQVGDARTHTDGAMQRQRSDAGSGRVDLERLKFRMVFILWPALVGITMAL
ncbi:hypothetical protein EIP86_003753 [Pleurotus ostreatoroseus]|nr:hypothetical protein EIP86_003753 [Pleurotus ostreatoroseus]